MAVLSEPPVEPKTSPDAVMPTVRIWRAVVVIAGIVVAADQVVKAVVADWLGHGVDRWELAGNLLAFEYVENSGAAFGILAGQTMLLAALAIAITAVFLYAMREEIARHWGLLVAVGMVIGGALGNLIDRVRLGYVVDYIAVGVWPKFNIADSCVVLGLLVMAWVAWNGGTDDDVSMDDEIEEDDAAYGGRPDQSDDGRG